MVASGIMKREIQELKINYLLYAVGQLVK